MYFIKKIFLRFVFFIIYIIIFLFIYFCFSLSQSKSGTIPVPFFEYNFFSDEDFFYIAKKQDIKDYKINDLVLVNLKLNEGNIYTPSFISSVSKVKNEFTISINYKSVTYTLTNNNVYGLIKVKDAFFRDLFIFSCNNYIIFVVFSCILFLAIVFLNLFIEKRMKVDKLTIDDISVEPFEVKLDYNIVNREIKEKSIKPVIKDKFYKTKVKEIIRPIEIKENISDEDFVEYEISDNIGFSSEKSDDLNTTKLYDEINDNNQKSESDLILEEIDELINDKIGDETDYDDTIDSLIDKYFEK